MENKQTIYDKELANRINSLMKSIPKEHRKTVKELNNIYYELGAKEVLGIVYNLSQIPAKDAYDYDVAHNSDMAGG